MLQYLLVRCVAQCDAPQVVLVHEFIEEVGTQHDGLRNLHGGIVKLVQFRMALDDVVEECQTAPLAA